MNIRLGTHGQVDCRADIRLDVPATSVWGQLRDFRRYASHDYFHRDIRVAGGEVRQGAAIRLSHAFAGFRVERVGRILVWREGHGFAFSDLSEKGPRVGFPHVLSVSVDALHDNQSIVHLRVRGRWTARWVPRFVRQIWLYWVFGYVVMQTQNELLTYAAARKLRLRPIAC